MLLTGKDFPIPCCNPVPWAVRLFAPILKEVALTSIEKYSLVKLLVIELVVLAETIVRGGTPSLVLLVAVEVPVDKVLEEEIDENIGGGKRKNNKGHNI